jgi:hypothetical protein
MIDDGEPEIIQPGETGTCGVINLGSVPLTVYPSTAERLRKLNPALVQAVTRKLWEDN